MINEKLKILRKQANKTQRDMAKLLNISQNAYCKYEMGTTEPNIQTLNQLANIFNVKIDYLIGNEEIKEEIKNISKNQEDEQIIQALDNLNEADKNKVIGYIQCLLDNKTEKPFTYYTNNSFNNNKINF